MLNQFTGLGDLLNARHGLIRRDNFMEFLRNFISQVKVEGYYLTTENILLSFILVEGKLIGFFSAKIMLEFTTAMEYCNFDPFIML